MKMLTRLSSRLWRSFTRKDNFCSSSCFSQLSYKAFDGWDREQIMKTFDDNGYIVLRNVITGQLMEEVRRHVDWLLEKYHDIPPEHLHHPIMRRDPFWMRLVSDSRLVDVASMFVGPDIAVFASHYFCKLPKTGKKVLWHQDGSYWPLEPMDVVSLWLSVDKSTVTNGCLQVVRGSHKSRLKELQSDIEGDNVLGSRTHSNVNEEDVVNIELESGDVEIHHQNIIHGSEANMSDTRRCGLTIRYIPTTTKCTNSAHPIYKIRGKEHSQVNCYRSWPRFMPGYHMTFEGSDRWNDSRYVNPDDEPYFDSLTAESLEQDVRREVMEVIGGLHTTDTGSRT